MLTLAQITMDAVQVAAKHVEDHTNIWLVVFAAVGPMLSIGGLAMFVVKYVMPIWRDEQAANRAQRAEEAEKTRQHLSEDREAGRAFADEQHKRLVDSISGRVDKLSDRIESMGQSTRAIAAKLGVVVALLLLFVTACLLASETPETFRLAQNAGEDDLLAKAGPVDRVCNGSNDCGAGCSCDRGECKCAADRPPAPPPQRQKRRVALSEGTLCADCQALPWMITEIETFPQR